MRMSPGSIQEGFILTSLQESVGKRDFSVQLCGISVPPWWNYSEKINHRDTEIAQRSTEFIFPTDSFAGFGSVAAFDPGAHAPGFMLAPASPAALRPILPASAETIQH